MTWLIQLLGALASAAFLRPLLTRAAILLGLGVVTYGAVSVGASAVWSLVATNLSSLPSDVLSVLTILKIPNAINVIISAYSAALGVKGLTAAGQLKRAVWRPGQSGDLFGAG